MPSLYKRPLDTLENVIDAIDWYEDLLSLALTCTRLHDLIVPAHLAYRRVVISIHFRPFFGLILSRPDLAGRVRELMLISTSPSNLVIPREHAFRREFPESRLLFASGYDDEFLYSTSEPETVWEPPQDLLTSLNNALSHLPRLRRLQLRGSIEGPPLRRIRTFDRPPFDRSCLDGSRMPDTLEEIDEALAPAPSAFQLSSIRAIEELSAPLRILHINHSSTLVEGHEVLDTLAKTCPNLEELFLPENGLWYRIMLTDKEKAMYEKGQAPEWRLDNRNPSLEEIMERFPSLYAVGGVAEGLKIPNQAIRNFYKHSGNAPPQGLDILTFLAVSKPLSRIHATYPLLRGIDRWRVDKDPSKKVSMTLSQTYKLRRGEAYVVLTPHVELGARHHDM